MKIEEAEPAAKGPLKETSKSIARAFGRPERS
jgi:hypothetical protein